MAEGRKGTNSSYEMHRERENSQSSDNLRLQKEKDKDDPPNSRLFIVCGKSLTEEDFREHFEKFGVIEEIWVLKHRATGEPKGIAYIKFSKTSEAAQAMEEMNGRCIGSHPRPLKVLIAHSREQGSRRDCNEEERLLRLFVVVPKTMTESELREHFVQFGDIDYVSIVKDKHTKESKGFAYVKYHRVSHAARAYENCEKSFKPVFADPRPPKTVHADSTQSNVGSCSSTTSNFDNYSYENHSGEGYCKLTVVASSTLNQDQLWKLFDLIPGLDYCELKRDPKYKQQGRSQATVLYSNPSAASYAKEKLHGFEYPPGHRLIVKYDSGSSYDSGRGTAPVSLPPASSQYPGVMGVPNLGGRMQYMPPLAGQSSLDAVQSVSTAAPGTYGMIPPASRTAALQNNLATLAETIAQATSLIQAAGAMSTPGVPSSPGATANPSSAAETYDPSYCSVKLPLPQPLAPMESPVAERLFIVCQPAPPPIYVLKDIFGRFGNLIDVYMLGGRSCGYAKYADQDCANRALTTLHGQEVCGARLKVMQAEPPSNSNDTLRKRIRMEDQ